ncbi:MAG: hypothetical protein R3B49_04820 [Phycisphaerales bacterium]
MPGGDPLLLTDHRVGVHLVARQVEVACPRRARRKSEPGRISRAAAVGAIRWRVWIRGGGAEREDAGDREVLVFAHERATHRRDQPTHREPDEVERRGGASPARAQVLDHAVGHQRDRGVEAERGTEKSAR